MDADAYLDRIAYRGPRRPTAGALRDLHRAHLLTVPFENLDIALGRPIVLSLEAFFEKIVRRRHGGFCYELNGLFSWLLEQLGFPVVMLSARVFQDGQPGPEFDHLTLMIPLEDRLLADVGFGDLFLEPLRLEPGTEQAQRDSACRLSGGEPGWVLSRRRPGSDWEPQYAFSTTARGLAEFAARCRFQQTSPESAFTRKSVCSLAAPDGRVTVSNGRLIVTTRGRREERDLTSGEEYRETLRTRFGVELGEDAAIARLLARGTRGSHPA